MKIKVLVDSTITIKAGQIVDVDDKQFQILRSLNRAVAFEKEEKKEKEIVETRETRKKAKK